MGRVDLRALVTGASGGIGAAYARALHARGERLILVARSAERLDAMAAELGKGADAVVLPADLSDPAAPTQLAAEVERRGLGVDLLVNNAGSGDTGRFWEEPTARVTGMVDLNARALVDLTRRFLPGMIGRGRGRIVNVVSNGAFQPVPFLAVYAATKSFVLSFTEALAVELSGTGVEVQALCPGLTETGFFAAARTGEKLLVSRLPRMTPEAVVAASLRGLDRGRLRVVPGFLNRALAALVAVTPNRLAARVASQLYRPR
jgi:short-subunit dehydrogenase